MWYISIIIACVAVVILSVAGKKAYNYMQELVEDIKRKEERDDDFQRRNQTPNLDGWALLIVIIMALLLILSSNC